MRSVFPEMDPLVWHRRHERHGFILPPKGHPPAMNRHGIIILLIALCFPAGVRGQDAASAGSPGPAADVSLVLGGASLGIAYVRTE